MEKYRVGIIGGTGMVGQRFVTLMENHPWFQLAAIAASPRSAGKTYEEAVSGRWAMPSPIPEEARALVVLDAQMNAGYDIDSVLACTYQAISGSGKTFERWPEMVDNLIPYIGGEEEKSEQEPLKVWGHIEGGSVLLAELLCAEGYIDHKSGGV